ncbi:MAG TPA: hypothetical protein PK325_11095 [Cyclobacteriaceae bacterium]|nr:hypothetical protein [Cyclobacteriaceae bacterium]HMV07293.1 hypothetical protein [Cyclobacteriaceae bacterium]HMV89255.1 hypothetical protein [Cyclobacteriaceae bacterium]HMW99352.1 hypothetical protein [Cyclobacteriaceae bacterium]HMX48859.1 hypothetical protein [Cyclobacteriaceae bacterium]
MCELWEKRGKYFTFLRMKKKECPACAMEVDEKSSACPICGYEFTSTGGSRKWIAVFLLVLIALYFFGRFIF